MKSREKVSKEKKQKSKKEKNLRIRRASGSSIGSKKVKKHKLPKLKLKFGKKSKPALDAGEGTSGNLGATGDKESEVRREFNHWAHAGLNLLTYLCFRFSLVKKTSN